MRSNKTRTPPKRLIQASTPTANRSESWYKRLAPADRKYVDAVVAELRKSPPASHYMVAAALVKELNLPVGRDCVARYLKERLHEQA